MTALNRLIAAQATERLRAHDASLWSDDAAERQQVDGSLGWTHLATHAAMVLPVLSTLAGEFRREGLDDIVLFGMGGSSLATLVMSKVLPADTRMQVLDTTCPDTVLEVLGSVDPARTAYLVASKSGGTIEPNTLASICFAHAEKALGARDAARRFIALTDPGSSLEQRAREAGWRAIVPTPVDVGGRYSALTPFGLLPITLAGANVHQLVATARNMEAQCALPDAENPGAALAAYIADAHDAGADKLTIVASPELAAFGLWVEQLVAESLGKFGRGVVPVIELSRHPHTHGLDRAIVVVRYETDRRLAQWTNEQRAQQPVAELVLGGPDDLGAEFVRWEHAVALAGVLLGVNPFDQPNVAEAKDATSRVLAGELQPPAPSVAVDGVEITFAGALRDPGHPERSVASAAAHAFSAIAEGDYLAILAYLPDDDTLLSSLLSAVPPLARVTGAATCLELGPRYLHSTGQLHKGGPNSGVFVLVTSRDETDADVPGETWSLRDLFRAQADGDLITLAAHGRRVVRFDLPHATEPALAAFADELLRAAGVQGNV